MPSAKKVLLVDLDDARRDTRIKLLSSAGYDLDVQANSVTAEHGGQEGEYDLVIVALHQNDSDKAAAYTDRISRSNPGLPILLLIDHDVYVPCGTLSPSIE